MINATRFVGDADIEKILLATYEREMTPRWISATHGIPLATCHRKVRMLVCSGLLVETRNHLCRDGKVLKFYIASLERAFVHYDGSRVKIRFKIVLDITREYRRRCEELARRNRTEMRIRDDSWLDADISCVRDIPSERKRR